MSTYALRLKKAFVSKIHVPAISLPSLNWRMVVMSGIFAVIMLSLLYVYQVNQLTRGYYLTNISQQKMDKLASQNRDLQVSFAESGFLDHILAASKSMDFESANNVQYIKVLDSAFALAK